MTRPSLSDLTRNLANYDPDAIPVQQAQELIAQLVKPVAEAEYVGLHEALGRVLAADLISPISVPAHDNSAMDGYAFAGRSLATSGATVLRVVGSALAGKPFVGTVNVGTCVRIMTGAVMPADCDTVAPQELVALVEANLIQIGANLVCVGDHRRLCGEDLAQGQPALSGGRILRPSDLGLIASLGIGQVLVRRRLRVAYFSTGDELRSLGDTLDPGCIYDSNRYTLFGMLTRLGCELIDLGVVKDNPALLEMAFRNACTRADVVITSGGVSVGLADYTPQTIEKLGDVAFWKIRMRPGRPMTFGIITSEQESAYMFGLPGNPVAVMVTFYFMVRSALLLAMGALEQPLPKSQAVSESLIRKKDGRTEYQRGIVTPQVNGPSIVRVTGSQGSGVLRSMSEANCIIVLHEAQGTVAPGDLVDVYFFDGLV